jgi:hypothetical protein
VVSNEELKRKLQMGRAKVQEKAANLGRKEQEVKAITAAALPVPNPTLVVKAPPAVTPGPQKSPTSIPGGGERRAAHGHDSARG